MDDKPFETLNVVPFIDIMLVLLVMVLTTATFVTTGRIPVSLPQASAEKTDRAEAKLLELGRDGALAFAGERIGLDALPARIGGLPPDTAFVIRADKDVPLQDFVDVAEVLKAAKFTHVAIQTRARAPGEGAR